jgi:hypothetical protein
VRKFLEDRLKDNVIGMDFLSRTGTIPRLGGELAMVDTAGRLVRVPEQDPLLYLYSFLNILVEWKSNTEINPVAKSFKQALNSILL